ncbi:tetratricopeptide repeat protein [Pontiellaceae bacterium B1224]|nr:tetratricopeptide repeat protein [Pontiellaceae bacterium B1224]
MRWLSSILIALSICSAEAAFVLNNAGRQIQGTKISADADGAVTLTTTTGQKMTFRKGQYRSAVADRPRELAQAEQLLEQGQGEQAVPLLKQVKQECRYLAWDQAAIQLLADYYFSSGRFAEALNEFQTLEDQSDPIVQRKIRGAMVKSGTTESVLLVLNADIATGSREAAAQAYLMRGELKATAGDLEGARRDWLKVVTFFKAQKKSAQLAEDLLKE